MESKGLYLNEIPQSGEITLRAAVVEKEIRPKRNGGSYLALRLADRAGELEFVDRPIGSLNCFQRKRLRIERIDRSHGLLTG